MEGAARAQAEAADLRGRDIDIVRTRKIVGVRAAQEAEAVRQDLEHAVGDDLDFLVGQGLEDGEQQVLLAQVRGVLDLEPLGEGDQIGRRLLVQLGEGDAAIGDDRLAVVLILIVIPCFLIDHGQVGGGDLIGRQVAVEGLGLGSGRIGVADVGHGKSSSGVRARTPAERRGPGGWRCWPGGR